MKALLVKNGSVEAVEASSIEGLMGKLNQADRLWVDLTIDEFKGASPILRKMGVSEAFVSKALTAKRSKCILTRGVYHVYLPVPLKAENFAFKPVVVSFNDKFMVTVHPKECRTVEKGLMEAPYDVMQNMSQAAAFVIEGLMELFHEYVETLELEASNLEELVVMGGGRRPVLKDILELKRRVINTIRHLWSVKGSLYKIKRGTASYMTPEVAFRFDDAHDDVTRQIEILEAMREVIADNVEVFTVTVFNSTNEAVVKTNESIRKLTVITLYLAVVTTVIGFPNTVATIFGVPTIAAMVEANLILILLVVSTLIPLLWILGLLKPYKGEW